MSHDLAGVLGLESRLEAHLFKPAQIHPSAFIAPNATVIGDVTLHEKTSVWYGAVLRGDIQSIVIGAGSNIQDNCVVHLDNQFGTRVGEYVTVGHRAVLHACEIGDEVLVGMGATILDGVKIGPRCIIGAHALVTMNTVIPEGSMVLGAPARVTRSLDLEQQLGLRSWAEKYVALSRVYMQRVHPRNPNSDGI
ncbi:MAG: gamma carbonic anhydrase family protein [Verrucomicrobiales bacterium]